ncbi:MAG TPA: glycosyltransferase [Pyrinomonadaceae bacterium]|nr:glycosyltransferase [Pyrinomonadaceae bacterium]
MKVSVAVVTYNHEKYISRAVESALMQEADFDYEIVVGEDCSTDRTRDILIELQRRNPDRVRLLLHERNGGDGGKRNFVETYRAFRGEYIALLDGDDYWTSPHKLRRQVEFLDGHREYSECFHNVLLCHEDGSEPPRELYPRGQKELSTVEDLLKGNNISSCSVMFRRGLFGELPAWFTDLEVGDWPLHILNAERGPVGYLDELMAVYRFHGGGTWVSRDYPQRLKLMMKTLEVINRHFNYRYQGIIRATVSDYCYELATIYEHEGNVAEARAYTRRCVIGRIRSRRVPENYLLVSLLRLYAPNLYKPLRGLSRFLRKGSSVAHRAV